MNAETAFPPSSGAHGSPGEAIRVARERARLSMDELAARTRLARPTLEALEHDAFDQLLEPVYVRGYYRKVARVLGLAEEPLIKAYQELYTPPPRTAPARLRLASGGELGESSRLPRSLAVIAPIAAIVICAVIWVLRDSRNGTAPASQITMIDPTSGTDVPVNPPPSSGPSSVESTAPGGDNIAASGATATPPAGEAPAAGAASSPAATAGTSATTAAAQVATAPAATGTQLVLTFKSISWARVEDRSGKSLLSGVISAGETRTVDGQPPYSVFLGNAPGVAVQFHGLAMDIKPFTKDNSTARFSVPVTGG